MCGGGGGGGGVCVLNFLTDQKNGGLKWLALTQLPATVL